MARLTEEQAERLRVKTVEVMLDLRAAYLAGGANALKHWTQIEDRMRAATRTSSTPAEWASAMKRGLQLSGTSSSLSRSVVLLSEEVASAKVKPSVWLDLVERESGYLIALARMEAEDRKARREER